MLNRGKHAVFGQQQLFCRDRSRVKAQFCSTGAQQAYCSTNVGGVVKYPGPLNLQRDQRYDRGERLQCGGGGDVLHASRLNRHNDDFQLFDLRDEWVGDGDLQRRQSVRQRKSAAGHVLFGSNGPASRQRSCTQNNNCSVVNAPGQVNGTTNSCSTDGSASTMCSVLTNNLQGNNITTDKCSVITTMGAPDNKRPVHNNPEQREWRCMQRLFGYWSSASRGRKPDAMQCHHPRRRVPGAGQEHRAMHDTDPVPAVTPGPGRALSYCERIY